MAIRGLRGSIARRRKLNQPLVLAKRMDAKTIEIPSSHVVMLSHSKETAAVIIQAAAEK
jgi:hypothetical protein